MPVVSKTTVRLYPPDIEIIDAWAAENPDPDTGLTPSRPTAIRRLIRSAVQSPAQHALDADHAPASRSDLEQAVTRILDRVSGSDRRTE